MATWKHHIQARLAWEVSNGGLDSQSPSNSGEDAALSSSMDLRTRAAKRSAQSRDRLPRDARRTDNSNVVRMGPSARRNADRTPGGKCIGADMSMRSGGNNPREKASGRISARDCVQSAYLRAVRSRQCGRTCDALRSNLEMRRSASTR